MKFKVIDVTINFNTIRIKYTEDNFQVRDVIYHRDSFFSAEYRSKQFMAKIGFEFVMKNKPELLI